MQHKKSVLFLISLSQNKIDEIETKGVDYQLFMKTIRSFSHVEVYETINENLISRASLYDVVVIVGHQVNGCIEMPDGSLFPMSKIAISLPSTFSGYLHVAVCGSTIIWDTIKKRCQESRVRTSNNATQLELQLLIYSILLRRTELNKDSFDYWYELYRAYIKDIQERKEPADLAKLPCATKLGEDSSDDVKTTVYSPLSVVRGECFSILIAMHFDADNGTLFVDRRRNDPSLKGEEPREQNVVLNDVHYGDKLSIKMSFEDATKHPTNLIWINNDDNPKLVTISDKIELEFEVFVDTEYPCSYFKAILEYIKDGHCLKMFDYHKYLVKSVFPQYYNKIERPQLNITGDKTWQSLQPECINSKKGKGRTSRAGEKVTKAFNYKIRDNKFANNRLVELYKALLSLGWIREDTQQQTFIDLFSGGDCSHRIVWMDDVNTLADLFRRLVRVENFVDVQSPYGLWQMVDGHFWEKEGNKPFGNERLRKTHAPYEKSRHIDYLVNILNPRISKEQLKAMLESEIHEDNNE